MGRVLIYGLVETRSEHELYGKYRYVGKTILTLKKRLNAHIQRSRARGGIKYPVNYWITKIILTGSSPGIILLDSVDPSNWEQFEKYHISICREEIGNRCLNVLDGGQSGPRLQGEKHPNARYSDDQVCQMRRMYRDGDASLASLAELYCTTPSHISQLIKGEIYKHLPLLGPPDAPYKRGKLGESNGSAILTDLDVLQIRELYDNGRGQPNQLSKMYGVSRDCILNAATGKSWKHLPGAIVANNVYRSRPGSCNPNSKLMENDVREIRLRCSQGQSYHTISTDFPVGIATIKGIVRGHSWKHVDGPLEGIDY